MRWKRSHQPLWLGLAVVVVASALGCHVFEDDDAPVLALKFVEGHQLAGTFEVGLPFPRNTPTVIGAFGLSVPQQLLERKLRLECQLTLPEGVPAPKRFVVDWSVRDALNNVLDQGQVKLRVRSDLSCRPRTASLAFANYPGGVTAQIAVTAKKRPLAVGTVVQYRISVL